MKTIVKINPDKEYDSAKKIIGSLALTTEDTSEISSLSESVDNLKTVINVLIERATPKKRVRPKRSKPRKKKQKKKREEFDKLPSEKFPHLTVTEKIARSDETPLCPCCELEMTESGLYKTSEKLETTPKQYHITRTKRIIYNCGSCHGSMINAPSSPSISRSSNYGDSLIIDAALSKYCDLIPMERYCAMAAREGLEGLPPNSLITISHALAAFLMLVYEMIKKEIQSSKVLLADETPHKMLEGDDTSNWFLWGFSSKIACVFEAHGTRSGAVPLNFLKDSKAKYLLSDGYSGYKKAINDLALLDIVILETFCNAHAFRYFDEARATWESEAETFLETYGKIYALEQSADDSQGKIAAREQMKPLFRELKQKCEAAKADVMPNSSIARAIGYFLNHYEGLIRCTDEIDIPLDNNSSERSLRSPVVGRKTWYGTHSKRGAHTNAVLFSIVETCKMNQINPRNYFHWVTSQIHSKQQVLTPHQYSLLDSG